MSQTLAFVLPLPVTLALFALMLGLLALSALALSLHKPAPIHLPSGRSGLPGVGDADVLQSALQAGQSHPG